jgi:WD40 repeat protein
VPAPPAAPFAPPAPPPPRRRPGWRVWAAAAAAFAGVALVLAFTLPGSAPPSLHTGTPVLTTLTVPGGGQVGFAQFSPDGKVLIAYGITTDIYVWDATTGKFLRTLQAPAGTLTNWFAFTPDDKSVIGVSELSSATTDNAVSETMYSWDIASGTRTKLRALPVPANWVLSGDDSTMASESGDTVTVTDLAAGTIAARLSVPGGGPADPGLDLSFDQSGDRILVASKDKVAYVWDVKARQVIQHVSYPVKTSGYLVAYPRLSWDGAAIVVLANDSNSGPSSLWDVATGANITPHDPRWPTDDNGCLFSEDSQVCATDAPDRKTVDLWDVATHKFLLAVSTPNHVADGGVTDVGPGAADLVTLGPVNSEFYTGKLYLWTIP